MASPSSHRFLLLWSALAAAGGCGQILGISDYEVDPKLGSSSSSAGGEGGNGDTGSGGKDGVAGTTSTAGKATTAGQPNEGGVGGEPMVGSLGGAGAGPGPDPIAGAGAGGEAGAGGAPPLDKFTGCDGTPFQGNEAIVRSCILRVGCQIWNYPSDSISRCVSQNTQNTYEGTKCTLDAQTCADITDCEGSHIEKTFCTGKADGQYCNGNEVVTCSDYPHARDCTKYGGTCHDFGVELGSSTETVDCALSAVTTCAATTVEGQCGGASNAYRYQCEGTVAYGTKCSNFAASCQEVGGDIGCYYPLNNCSVEGVSCANGRATWCDGASKAIFDCGSVGLGCATEGDYYEDNGRQCAAPGCTPTDVVDCKESCKGTNLTFCYGGAPVTVDCKDYGFTKCAEYDYDCSGFAMNDCLYTSDTISYAECE
jgi:hypothetical protein